MMKKQKERKSKRLCFQGRMYVFVFVCVCLCVCMCVCCPRRINKGKINTVRWKQKQNGERKTETGETRKTVTTQQNSLIA